MAIVTFAWNAPTTNEDGTPLTDLSHYTLYVENLAVGMNITGTTFQFDPTPYSEGQTLEVWVTASDTSGNESLPSNTVDFAVPFVAPSPPTGLEVS